MTHSSKKCVATNFSVKIGVVIFLRREGRHECNVRSNSTIKMQIPSVWDIIVEIINVTNEKFLTIRDQTRCLL